MDRAALRVGRWWSVARCHLERALRPSVVIAGRSVSTFQVCGVAGFLAAIAVGLALGARLGLSMGWIVALWGAAVLSFFALAIGMWVTLGVERLVFYRHEIVVLALVALASAASGRRALPYLDVATVALGAFLAVGRIGCMMVGCCHGRPTHLGLRYGPAHARAGFAAWLVGVPLVPVQAIESAAVASLTVAAAVRLWNGGAPPGALLARQLASYALLRFALEFARGDGDRASWLGLSEAQWTALVLAMGVAGSEWTGVLPPSAWHAAAAAALAGAAVLVLLRGRRARLLAPTHVAEIARAVRDDRVTAAAHLQVLTTSLGVRLSASVVKDAPSGPARIYTLSGVDVRAARSLATLILLVRQSASARERSNLVEARPGFFHLIVTSVGDG